MKMCWKIYRIDRNEWITEKYLKLILLLLTYQNLSDSILFSLFFNLSDWIDNYNLIRWLYVDGWQQY